MQRIPVTTPGKTYEVIIGSGILNAAGELAAQVTPPGIAAIITDDIVDPLYAPRLEAALKKVGFQVVKYVFPHGEKSKNPAELFRIVNFLAEHQLTGKDTVFALGGGVTGDLAGFAAAIYRRGIHLIQIPTTLLAEVDSSVGGKTAVDLPAGKNLAGAYYQPELVLCDYQTLDTLPAEVFADGLGEVIKYGAILGRDIFSLLSLSMEDNLEEVLARCVSIKSEIVGRDEKDTGERKLLNFGHTFGHAIEACSSYEIPHGKAVAIGMVLMTRAAVKKGLCPRECLDSLLEILRVFGLPTDTDFPFSALYETLLVDKKRKGDNITLVVPETPGKCRLLDVTIKEAGEFLRIALEK